MAFLPVRYRVLVPLLGAVLLTGVSGCGDSCSTTLAEVCSPANGGCPMTWAAAQDVNNWQGLCAAGETVMLTRCTGVDVASISTSIETGTAFQYDLATGALFDITNGGRETTCSGTPEIACDNPVSTELPCGQP